MISLLPALRYCRSFQATLLAAILTCLITGCSSSLGTQQGSSQGGAAPLVVVTPIGHKATSAAGADPVAITVRSGADVLLSGKDSQSRGAPLTGFSWMQATTDTSQVTLLYRTSNTVDFTAPTVSSPTVLNFTLNVQDSNGVSAHAHAVVTVMPASDLDQFLTTPVTNPSQRVFQVAVVPLHGLANLQADVPVCISMDRTIHYTSHDGQPASVTLARRAQDQIDAAWLQATGAAAGTVNLAGPPNVAAAVASYTNPRATFEVPNLNDDDLFVLFNQPPQPQLSRQLVPADIDAASMTVTLEATPGKCGYPGTVDSSNPFIVTLVNDSGPLVTADPANPPADPANLAAPAAPGTLAVLLDALRQVANGSADCAVTTAGTLPCTETAASAAAYYQTIDPIGSAPRASQTMNAWLDANCFNSTATNYGADTHTVYTNNFDLGFGRDMYFVTCTTSNLSATSLSAGRVPGDSASIVINYPSLESVVIKQNPILAVAMSHNAYSANTSALPQGRITKFFAFAPDDRDGGFYLVRSANFDHRGQRYLPGSCTVCHGGKVNASNIASGDLDSAFLPWDESALLFADTDPSYTGAVVPKAGYTQADQTAAIYAMNQHAYATYLNSCIGLPSGSQTASQCSARFAAPEALIQKWYGGTLSATPTPSNHGTYTYTDITFNSSKFDDSGFPLSSVDPSSTWANEASTNGDDIYHNVFAHQCRACHTQLNPTAPLTAADQFLTYTDFKNEFVRGGNDISNLVLGKAVMPLARLTADRMWVSFNGGSSPATLLATRIQADGPSSGLIDNGTAVASGTQLVSPSFAQAPIANPTSTTVTGANNAVTRFYQVRVDASLSYFVNSYSWSLCDPSGVCTGNLVGGAGGVPAFATSLPGTYRLSLTGINSAGQSFGPVTYPFTVAEVDPSAPSCTYTVPIQSQPTTITLTACAAQRKNANGQPNTTSFRLGDGINTLTVTGWSPSSGYGPSTYTFSCDSSSPACSSSMSIPVTVAQANGPSLLSYTLCDGAPNQVCSTGAIEVEPTAGPSAALSLYSTTLPLVANATSGATSLPAPSLTLSRNPPYYTAQIPLDSLPSTGPCAGNPGDAASLARSFTITPCTDSFTLALGVAAPAGPYTLGGTDQYQISIPLTQTPNCNAAGVCNTGSSGPQPYTLPYTVADTVTTATQNSASSNIQVNILATQSFSAVAVSQGAIYDYLATNWSCTGCHSGDPTGATSAMPQYYWGNGSPPSSPLPATTAAWESLNGSHCASVGCIDTTTPTSSRLYNNACVGPHIGGLDEHHADTTLCANLAQWLTEGAQNN